MTTTAVAAEPLELWTLTRIGIDHIVTGDAHEMIVAAATPMEAREWAVREATLRNDTQRLVWRSPNEHVIRVSHLGTAEPSQVGMVLLSDTWTGGPR